MPLPAGLAGAVAEVVASAAAAAAAAVASSLCLCLRRNHHSPITMATKTTLVTISFRKIRSDQIDAPHRCIGVV